MYIASSVAAVALIVIDVDTVSSGMLGEQRVHVVDGVDRDAHAPDFAERARRIGVEAHLRREIERDGEPRLSRGEQRRKRAFVSVAVPKPAYWRIVHSRPRYIVGCTPRVNGKHARIARSRA